MDHLIQINQDAKEPNEYFKLLKAQKQVFDVTTVQNQLNIIAEHLLVAKDIGQTSFVRQLAFMGDTLLKEQILYSHTIREFILIEDIKRYIDLVKPKNSVKLIELDRYPRAIPMNCMKDIAEAQELGVFTEFHVVFTDFSDKDYKTPEEKKVVDQNRDPIVFGVFIDKDTGRKHQRAYVITEWEDEHCDLTLNKMVKVLSDNGVKNPAKVISQDAAYIQGLIGKTLDDTASKKPKENYRSKFNRLFKWLK